MEVLGGWGGVGNRSWIGRLVLTLEAGMFEPLCSVQAAHFLIDTQVSLFLSFMTEKCFSLLRRLEKSV